MTDPLHHWPTFSDAVRSRLEAGRIAYADQSFERAPAELVTEIEAELLDVCGWAFILHERLRRMGELLKDIEPKRGANQNIREGASPKVETRTSVAEAAGLSPHQTARYQAEGEDSE